MVSCSPVVVQSITDEGLVATGRVQGQLAGDSTSVAAYEMEDDTISSTQNIFHLSGGQEGVIF